MPRRKEQRFNENRRPIRKSEFAPDRECYMDAQGNYTYNQWVQQSNGRWELVPVCTARIGEDGVTSDLTIVLDDMDCEEDRQNNLIRKHRDSAFEAQRAAYEADQADEDGDKRRDPWECVSRQAHEGTDLLDAIFPDEKPVDPRMAKLLELMDTLTNDQRELIYAHLGQGKYFEEIAAEQNVGRTAISNRWDRIIAKLCRGFGVEKPVRRNDRKIED